MSLLTSIKEIWELNRARTLDEIAKQPNPAAALGWRPGPGRAHMAWQMMHIGITEELFATERLFGKTNRLPEVTPRFKGGSTPDDNIPSVEQIRELLSATRQHLLEGINTLTEADLSRIPEALTERGWTIAKSL